MNQQLRSPVTGQQQLARLVGLERGHDIEHVGDPCVQQSASGRHRQHDVASGWRRRASEEMTLSALVVVSSSHG